MEIEVVSEEGVGHTIWTEEGGSDRRVDKSAY
jgi:hypothetical protein